MALYQSDQATRLLKELEAWWKRNPTYANDERLTAGVIHDLLFEELDWQPTAMSTAYAKEFLESAVARVGELAETEAQKRHFLALIAQRLMRDIVLARGLKAYPEEEF
jgi:hypothetical protein